MWRTLFESVTGSSHDQHALPCQDACRVISHGQNGQRTLVVACADGAGSAANSDIGAQLACEAFVRIVEDELARGARCREIDRSRMAQWYAQVRERLIDQADMLGTSPKELACTLLVAIIDSEMSVYAQIGDGCIVAGCQNNLRAVFWPQSGEYANTTNFVISPDVTQLFEFQTAESPEECAIFTDGIERLVLKFSDKTVHEPFLRPLFNTLRQSPDVEGLFAKLRDFLGSKSINDRTDDDKTLILVVKESAVG